MSAPEPPPTSHRTDIPESVWFWDHYNQAADNVIEFLAGEGITFRGKAVADVGCGDGIIDLGLVHKGKPSLLHGFDVNLTDTRHLSPGRPRRGYARSCRGSSSSSRASPGACRPATTNSTSS